MHTVTPEIAAAIREARVEKFGFSPGVYLNTLAGHYYPNQDKRLAPLSVNPDWYAAIEFGTIQEINSIRAAALVAVLGVDFWETPEREPWEWRPGYSRLGCFLVRVKYRLLRWLEPKTPTTLPAPRLTGREEEE